MLLNLEKPRQHGNCARTRVHVSQTVSAQAIVSTPSQHTAKEQCDTCNLALAVASFVWMCASVSSGSAEGKRRDPEKHTFPSQPHKPPTLHSHIPFAVSVCCAKEDHCGKGWNRWIGTGAG